MKKKLIELFFYIAEIFTVFGFGWLFSKVVNTSLTTFESIVFMFSAIGTCCLVQKKYNSVLTRWKEQETNDGG